MHKQLPLPALAGCALACIVLPSVDAAALVINADYQGKLFGIVSGVYSGQGALPDPGNGFWNAIEFDGQGNTTAPTSITPALRASDGSTATGASLTLVNPFNFNQEAFGRNDNFAIGYNDLLGDYVDGGGGGGTARLDGLDPDTSYNLALYKGGTSGSASFTIDGLTLTATSIGVPHPLTPGVDYVIFNNVTPDDSGSIAFTYFGQHAGLQIQDVVVPEPGTAAVAASGALLLLRRRRAS